MNINFIFNFVQDIIDLFANWLSSDSKEWAWCPVRVDNRDSGF